MAFGGFKVLAGDFKTGDGHQLLNGKLEMNAPGKLFRESIPLAHVQSVEIVSQENGRANIGGAVVGAALFGVVGAVVGASAGSGGEATFTCTLRDQRAFMATAPIGVYNELVAATFRGGVGAKASSGKTTPATWLAFLLIILAAIVCLSATGNHDRAQAQPAAPSQPAPAAVTSPPPASAPPALHAPRRSTPRR